MDGQAKVSLILELKNKLKSGLDRAKQYVNTSVKEMKDRLSSLKTSHIEAFKAASDNIPGISGLSGMIANPYTLVIAGVLALTAAYGKASHMAQDFDSAMAKANVTAQENAIQLKQTSDEILKIAAHSNLKDAAAASPQVYNVLLSSGMDKQNAMDTVAPTLAAAKAGFTDVETVAKAAAASMNSSGIKDATRLYDILFATLNKGNAEFSDIAQYLPKIIPAARLVGLNMEQVAGSFAYLTAQGQTSERAATLLENAFKTLADPEKAKSFKRIGVEMYTAEGKIRPLISIVDDLNYALKGLTDQQKSKLLSSLGLDMESIGAFSAMAQDAGSLRQSIDFVTNSTGQFQKSVESAKTPMDSWDQISNEIDTAWIKIGEHANESLGKLGDRLLPIIEKALPAFIECMNTILDLFGDLAKPIEMLAGVTDPFSGLPERGFNWERQLIGLETTDQIKAKNDQYAKANEDLGKWLGDHMPTRKVTESPLGNTLKSITNGVSGLFGDLKRAVGIEPSAINLYKKDGPNAKVQKVLDEIDNPKNRKGKKGDPDNPDHIQGSTPRTVNFNIQSVIAGDFISKNEQFTNMSPKDFEKWFTEMMMRMQRNAELGYN